jgi:hypothetical protein
MACYLISDSMATVSPAPRAQNKYQRWCFVVHEAFLPASICLAAGFSSEEYLISTSILTDRFDRGVSNGYRNRVRAEALAGN